MPGAPLMVFEFIAGVAVAICLILSGLWLSVGKGVERQVVLGLGGLAAYGVYMLVAQGYHWLCIVSVVCVVGSVQTYVYGDRAPR